MQKVNPWAIILTVIITALVVGGGVYYWQTQSLSKVTATEEKVAEPEFKSLLYKNELYNLPFGSAEIEGYYTTVERPTSLDGSTPDVTCSAFVVTDGPSMLLEALTSDHIVGNPPTAVLGSENSNWGSINKSTKENPIKLLVTLNSGFEGEVMECMSWPFSSFTEI